MPAPKSSDAKSTFAAPGSAVDTPEMIPVLLGAREYERSFQVIMGMMVSMRGSTLAAAN